MGFQGNEVSIDMPYSLSDCFTAMKNSVAKIPNFKLKMKSEAAKTLQYSVSAGMTSFTFGDDVIITFSDASHITKITISASAKMFSLAASYQENKNIEKIIAAFSDEIKKYTPISTPCDNEQLSEGEIEARLKQLTSLHDKELISDEEFERKRKDILSEI